jgi:hypothetical protein
MRFIGKAFCRPPVVGKPDGSLGIVAAMVAAIASKTDGPALLMPAASPMGVYRGNEVQGQTKSADVQAVPQLTS